MAFVVASDPVDSPNGSRRRPCGRAALSREAVAYRVSVAAGCV
ncbi:unnamed protein product [Mycetohabitans rhizoxinica HKI 454]|uniref:Uncharacterized protein n=1 Tax=Mycetohabitans rhizoxinica (strain DSM 19002 / CIP 109453 / HKI 454) TaxID=882378 RepID=E5AS46_MYCRK|nr:unnamed protein product [Mycetohabitans rhizoxinica HKI 454]